MKSFVLILTACFFLTGTTTWADDKPFSSAELKDPSLCKYTSRIEHDGHATGLPRLFENVKAIYINVADNMLFTQGLEDVSILKPENIAIIAACALQKQIGKKHACL